jgi:cobalt-precorrin-5B (C1)-methyltransferase
MEIFALYAALCGAGSGLASRVMECATSEAAIGLLLENGLLEQVSGKITAKIEEHLYVRAGGKLKTAAVVFTQKYGLFGKTRFADELIKEAQRA